MFTEQGKVQAIEWLEFAQIQAQRNLKVAGASSRLGMSDLETICPRAGLICRSPETEAEEGPAQKEESREAIRDVNHFSEEKKVALLLRHMKSGSQTDRLQSLRASLQHFDHYSDFGDSEAVEAIRRHLMIRIRDAELAVQYSKLQTPHAEAA